MALQGLGWKAEALVSSHALSKVLGVDSFQVFESYKYQTQWMVHSCYILGKYPMQKIMHRVSRQPRSQVATSLHFGAFVDLSELTSSDWHCLDHLHIAASEKRRYDVVAMSDIPRHSNMTYPIWIGRLVSWQIGVGRLVSIKTSLFSGSMLIYQRVINTIKYYKIGC